MTPALAAIPAILFITLCYVALCAASPYGNCRTCRGFGFQLKQTRRGKLRRGRDCHRCHGHGKRVRLGRALYNHAARLHREGNAP
ncbi:hypothetical protein [Streptomyces boncukensis]|uniref:Uncharacterized protein n=1 Tax=Streptomyces boncukensis TaxID=2711219 RepID=A0A6G4WQC2_9ACTN|nr:hypothetical protein [Streptomyces boncukensis]NGO67469.1 hypothetical protein [Streptomyces boncukensis]